MISSASLAGSPEVDSLDAIRLVTGVMLVVEFFASATTLIRVLSSLTAWITKGGLAVSGRVMV